MVLWHNEQDSQRTPQYVCAEEDVELRIGTFPIEIGQHVFVEWKVIQKEIEKSSGIIEAVWHFNDWGRGNSYWQVKFGPFNENDTVIYIIRGQSDQGLAGPLSYSFNVGPQKS